MANDANAPFPLDRSGKGVGMGSEDEVLAHTEPGDGTGGVARLDGVAWRLSGADARSRGGQI